MTARLLLLLGAAGCALAGQPAPAAALALAWFGVSHRTRSRGPRFPVVSRRNPSSEAEAALLELRPGQILRAVDPTTFVVEPSAGAVSMEIWQTLPGGDFDEAWFELEVGAAPRVAGQIERLAPLLAAEVTTRSEPLELVVRGCWLGWIASPGARTLDDCLEEARRLRARLVEAKGFDLSLLEQPPALPLLTAAALVSDPDTYARTPVARGVRPGLRWMTRDRQVGLEAKLRALRLLAPDISAEETVAALEDLNGRGPHGGGLADKAAYHLMAKSPHVQVAAAMVLEQVGTPAHRALLARAQAAERRHRSVLAGALKRANAAIDARYGPNAAGALGLVEGGGGRLSISRGADIAEEIESD